MKRWLSVFVFLLVVTVLLLAGGAAAQTQCDTADALFKAQLYDAALTNYTAVLQQYPNLACASNGINESQRVQAINFYEKGLAYEKANLVDAAKAEYTGALKIDSNFSNATEALARLNGGIFTQTYTLYTFLRPKLEYIVVGAIGLLALFVLIFQILPRIRGFLKPSLDIQEFDKGATGLDIGKGLKAMVGASYKQLLLEGRHRSMTLVDGPTEKLAIPAPNEKVAPYFNFISELIDWLFPPDVIKLSGSLQKPGSCGAGITVTLVVNRTKEILGSYTIWQNDLDLETTPKKAEESTDPTSYYNLAEPAAIWVLFKFGNYSMQGWLARIKTRVSALFQSGNHSEKREFTIIGTNEWLSYAYFKAGVRWQLEGELVKAQKLYVESLGIDKENRGTLLNFGRMEMEEGQYQHAFERLKMAKEKSISYEAYKPEKSKDFLRNPIWYRASYSLALTYCYLNKRYESNLTKAMKETETLKEILNKSVDRQIKDKIVLECHLSTFEDEAKTLLELIQKANDDLQIAEKISQRPADKKTHVLIDRIQESVEAIRGAIKVGQKYEEKVLLEEVNKIENAINELLNDKPAPFVFIMSQAEEEAKNLVDTIEKAIDTHQKNEDKYTSDTKEQADKLVETIQKPHWQGQKKDDKQLKEFLELFYPMACIMYADTLLYKYGGEKMREANAIINGIEPSSLTYRGKYNMACYYSIVGEKRKEDDKRNAYRESLYHLEYALERGGSIVKWANKDPDLDGIREDKETKEDFAKWINKYAPQETPYSSDLPLAGIAIIGEAYARQLKENEIESYCDLILKAGTHSLREELAKKLGISTQLVHRWGLLADLMGIVRNTQNANLLEVAGVGSLKALQNVSDPCELANLLNEINKAMSLVSQTILPETVRQWVQEANKTELKVLRD
jgi:tetratricopeptide (TPR) repeat protein